MFIRKSTTKFCIISIYVDDLNIIDHTKDIDEPCNHLKMGFKMKDLGRIKFRLGLQLENLHTCYSPAPACLCTKDIRKVQYG
jgi:hypothetical protein